MFIPSSTSIMPFTKDPLFSINMQLRAYDTMQYLPYNIALHTHRTWLRLLTHFSTCPARMSSIGKYIELKPKFSWTPIPPGFSQLPLTNPPAPERRSFLIFDSSRNFLFTILVITHSTGSFCPWLVPISNPSCAGWPGQPLPHPPGDLPHGNSGGRCGGQPVLKKLLNIGEWVKSSFTKSFPCFLPSTQSSQTCQQFLSQVISVSTVASLHVVIYPPSEKFSIVPVWIFSEKGNSSPNFHHFSFIALNIQIKNAELCFFSQLNTNYGSFCVLSSSLSMFYTLRRKSNFSLEICEALSTLHILPCCRRHSHTTYNVFSSFKLSF